MYINLTVSSTAALRGELETLRARYDSGAVTPAVFAIIHEIECELSWHEHHSARYHKVVR